MGKCIQCGVKIKDETNVCPLCQCVLEEGDDVQDTYPDVRLKTRKIMLAGRIYLFVAILTSAMLFIVNHEMYHGFWWSIIAVASIAYSYLVFRYAIVHDAGYKSKMIVLTIFGILTVILVDFVTGYHGWSVNYVIPSGIMFLDLGILLLMIINFRNWQSYLLFQLAMIVCSIVPLIFWRFGIVTRPRVSLIAFGVSVCLFLGTLIIGDRRARLELKRRFHVR